MVTCYFHSEKLLLLDGKSKIIRGHLITNNYFEEPNVYDYRILRTNDKHIPPLFSSALSSANSQLQLIINVILWKHKTLLKNSAKSTKFLNSISIKITSKFANNCNSTLNLWVYMLNNQISKPFWKWQASKKEQQPLDGDEWQNMDKVLMK